MQAPVSLRALLNGALLAVLVTATLPACADGIWKWRDANGSIQLSDRPPPSSVKAADILQRPSGAPAATSVPEAAPVPSSAAAPAVDPAAARRKSEADKAAASEKAAKDAAAKAARAEACANAQARITQVQSGVRLANRTADGGHSFLTDDERAQMLAKAQSDANQYCR